MDSTTKKKLKPLGGETKADQRRMAWTFECGEQAYREGIPESRNPYGIVQTVCGETKADQRRMAWTLGWHTARLEAGVPPTTQPPLVVVAGFRKPLLLITQQQAEVLEFAAVALESLQASFERCDDYRARIMFEAAIKDTLTAAVVHERICFETNGGWDGKPLGKIEVLS